MAHHAPKDDRDIITVKWTGVTYRASIDGDNTSCAAGPEMAAMRLASLVIDVPIEQVSVKELPDERLGYYKFAITNLN